MKFILLGMFCLLLAFSCSRTNQTNPTPNPAPAKDSVLAVLDSFRVYRLGPKEITYSINKMNYDGQGRLAEIYTTMTDSTLSGVSVGPSTGSFQIKYLGSDSLPSSYIQSWSDSWTGDDHGFILYDNQERLILDSQFNDLSHFVNNYQYHDGYISRISSGSLDTIFLKDNNISRFISQSATRNADGTFTHSAFYTEILYSYSALPNPFYLSGLSNHIGGLFIPGFDRLSRNLFSKYTYQFSSNNPYTINYSWTTNALGQVISGTGTEESTGKILEYYWFTYK